MSGDFELDWNGRALKRAAEEAAQAAVRETLERTAEAARAMAPRGETGELQDGIGFRMTGPGEGVVTSAAAHTMPVEKGANGVPGKHMFTRAKDREFSRHEERTGREFKKRARRAR